MKNRLEEIEKQSYTEVMHERGGTYMAFDKQKFAELILIEVTDILSTYRGKMVFEDGAEYNYQHPIIAIRKHFGVEL